MLSGAAALGGLVNPHHGMGKKLKSTQGDSSSTSPERSRKEETTSDTERRYHANEQHHEVSCGPTPTANAGNGSRKTAMSSKGGVASKKQQKANAATTTSPMLKYLKIRVSFDSSLIFISRAFGFVTIFYKGER